MQEDVTNELSDVIPEGATTITDLNAFGNLVVHWFLDAQQKAQHVLNMPEDIAIDVKDSEGNVAATLTEEGRKAFLLGVAYTMEDIFGNLPFLFQTEDTTDESEPTGA